MFATTRSMFELTAIVVALAANACAAHDVRSVASPSSSAAVKLSCVGGVVRSTADAQLYGACDHVDGDLLISAPELTDLSALAQLRSVSGKLEIAGNAALDDLSGLERLERVGQLSIHDNAELDDLAGLETLQVTTSVDIRDNVELTSLRGLSGLSRVERLTISHNGLFQTVGLSSLTEVGDLVVEGNAKLNSLEGLRSLAHARSVEIRNNPRLCGRRMLPALVRVDQGITVSQNRGLSQPEVRQLLGRVEHGLTPHTDDIASLELR